MLQTPELWNRSYLTFPCSIFSILNVFVNTGKGIIDLSPILQQALYFRPIPIGRKHNGVGLTLQNQHSTIFNPLLQEVFIEWFTASSYFNPDSRDKRECVAYIPMQRDNPEIFCKPEASWRRMLFQKSV